MSDVYWPVRVQTPSRLHFGLLAPGPGDKRRFGGIGLALSEPCFVLEARRSVSWEITGLQSERVANYVRHLLQQSELASAPPLHIHVAQEVSPHVGLGSGTQLGLALAWLVARSIGLRPKLADLLRWSGRGTRSVIGAAGFASGGLILDLGHRNTNSPVPTYLRLSFPREWRVAIFLPSSDPGLHGVRENEVFAQLGPKANCVSERLCRLVLLRIIPAILESDYETFAEGLWEYNRLAGECFRPWQDRHYHSGTVSRIIHGLRQLAPLAVGQSSWGPSVFMIAPEPLLQDVIRRLSQNLQNDLTSIIISSVNETGAIYCDQRQSGAVLVSEPRTPNAG